MSVKNDIGIQIYYQLIRRRIACMIQTLNHGWHQLPIHMCFCLIVEKDAVKDMDVMIMMSWKQVVHIDHIETLQCHQDSPRDNLRDIHLRGQRLKDLADHRHKSRQDGLPISHRSNHHNDHQHNDQAPVLHLVHNNYKPVQIDMIHQLHQHIRQEVKSRLIQECINAEDHSIHSIVPRQCISHSQAVLHYGLRLGKTWDHAHRTSGG